MAGGNDKGKKGFSGLSDLASEVSGIDEPIKPEPKAEAKPSAPKQPPQPQRKNTSSEPERKTSSPPQSRVVCPDGNCVGVIREDGKCGKCGKDKNWIETTEESRPLSTVAPPKKSGSSGGKWILGIIAVVFVIWLLNNGEQSTKKSSYNPPQSSQTYNLPQSSPPSAVQTTNNRPSVQLTREAQQLLTGLGYDPGPIDGQYGRRTSDAIKLFQRDVSLTQNGLVNHDLLDSLNKAKAGSKPTVLTQSEEGLQYDKPSIGTDNVLSVPEISWCLREGIRIEAMRNIIDNNEGIDEFNQIVNDYNNRCGSYRYRQGSLQRAEREVEAYRSQIVSEAIRNAKQLGRQNQPSHTSVSPSSSTGSDLKRPTAQYTREAQQILIDLGYDPGPADGQYGRQTADAVKAFQRDVDITQDGWIDEDFLSTLRTIKEKLLKTKADSSNTPPKRNPTSVTVTPQGERTTTITGAERAQIESYCSSVTYTPSDKNNCIERESLKLKQTGGRPSLSGISQSERAQIESYCSSVTYTPGDEYSCLERELRKLRQTSGKPILSDISQSEKSQIESYCSSVTYTPGDEYSCIERELHKLRQASGKPDLSSIPHSERSQIENYCSSVTYTPGDEYNCIERELRKLKQSGGKPDLSRISHAERSQVESYCSSVTYTPGDEYSCLERELRKLIQSNRN